MQTVLGSDFSEEMIGTTEETSKNLDIINEQVKIEQVQKILENENHSCAEVTDGVKTAHLDLTSSKVKMLL